jgi:hypothetical protein
MLDKLHTKTEVKKTRIQRSPLSPGMQEHVQECMGNVRNTRKKNIQIVHCVTKSVGHSQPLSNLFAVTK